MFAAEIIFIRRPSETLGTDFDETEDPDFTLSEWHIGKIWHVIELFRYMHLAVGLTILFTTVIAELFNAHAKDNKTQSE